MPEPAEDIYYLNMSQLLICGDCDDLNETINPGIAENSSINNGTCGNSIDDDCDGTIDCFDPSCSDSSPCVLPYSPSETQCGLGNCCSNSIDDDCNGKTDCADPDCFNDLSCTGNATQQRLRVELRRYSSSLHGYTFDDQEWPIDLATVTGFPPFKPLVTTFTDINGFYNFTVPSGVYNFKADKFGYDPDIDELTQNTKKNQKQRIQPENI